MKLLYPESSSQNCGLCDCVDVFLCRQLAFRTVSDQELAGAERRPGLTVRLTVSIREEHGRPTFVRAFLDQRNWLLVPQMPSDTQLHRWRYVATENSTMSRRSERSQSATNSRVEDSAPSARSLDEAALLTSSAIAQA